MMIYLVIVVFTDAVLTADFFFLQNLPPWQSQLPNQLTSDHSHHAILTMLCLKTILLGASIIFVNGTIN
jgi:hypothetical protein